MLSYAFIAVSKTSKHHGYCKAVGTSCYNLKKEFIGAYVAFKINTVPL